MKQNTIIYKALALSLLMIIGSVNYVWGYGETTSYVLIDTSNEYSLKTIAIGSAFKLNGPGRTLSFNSHSSTFLGATGAGPIRVEASIDNGSTWQEIYNTTVEKDYKTYTCSINPDVTHIRFRTTTGATLTKYYRNITITRATNITATTPSIDFGTQAVNASSTKSASFSYNNTTYDQQVTGECPTEFSVTPTKVGDTGSDSVNVNYSSSFPGVHSGTVTLSMNGATTTFKVSGKTEAKYYFSASAIPNYDTHGSATASVEQSSITSTNSTGSTSVTYTATPNSGYKFVGWGTSADATTYESTNSTYTTTISTSFPTTTASKTLYAIFRPVFYFSVDARKIYDHGTVTASVTDKVLGDPTETSKTAQATFTATPADGCTFEGWYYDQAHENKASSDQTYTPTITNNTIGSTENLTLYAWFKKNQAISWVEDITDFNLVVGTSANCAATASSGLTVTYKSSNGTTATVSTDGIVTGNAASNDGVVITASQLGNDEYHAATDIVRTFYVLEKYQATFTPNGFTGNNPTLKVGDTPTITVTNTDGDFTFTSSAPEVVGISREGDVITLTALKSGTATVTLNQAANATHSNSSAEYNITVERHQGGLAITIPETMKVGDTKRDFWVTNNDEVMVDVNIDNTSVLTYAEGTLTAVGEGTATVTVSQAETVKWAGESRQQTVVVSKVQNTLGVSITNQEATVDGTINVKLSNQNNISTPVLASITEQILSSAVTNGTDVITYADGIITAKNAGTAKITFTQAASDKYTEYTSATYEISVSKISNQISMTLNGQSTSNIKLEYNKSAKLAYTSAHTDSPLIVERTSGTCTTYTNNVISAGSNPGTDLYTISQAETYKYEAGYTTFSIRVNNTTEEEMYIINDPKEYYDFTLTTLKSYSFEGHPGDIVKFEAKRVSSLGSNSGFYLDYSTDNGATWQEKWYFISTTADYNTYAVTLPEDVNVTNVRFELYAGSTLNKYVRNVRVTRKTYVRASSDKTDFGTVYTGNTGNAHFTVDYSTTNGGNILLSSNNSNFALSTTELSTSENTDSTHTFDVTYTPDPNKLGSESATITISDLFYTQEFILTAKAEKRANSLSVISTQNLKVDATVNNVYSNKNSTAPLNVALSNEGVITYDEVTNTATAIGEGTTTLTFTQNANDQYYATSKSVTFVVTKNANTLNIALDKTDLKVEETANVTLSEKNSDGEITVAYTVDNIVTYDNDVITALNAGTTRITLTQAATASHTGTSQSFDITVSKHDQTISWDYDLSGSQLSLNIGETLNTNTAKASSQMEVTYTSSNPTILKVDANTGELTALAGGANIDITATQAGNYKYNEVSIKRSFTVISKIDATVSTTLSDQETNILTVGEGSVTIGSNATLSESNFTIEGNDNGYITTSFANNTLTITPIKAGGAITITLTRDEDNGYNAVRKSYDIMVEGPILTLDPTTAPAVEYAGSEYSEITLKRTLKAGFNSIALPFDTDVETLAGSSYDADQDWVAQLSSVTYNAHDGYTLYFKKISDGCIKANQPYILHLSAQVSNPAFSNVIVHSPQATSIDATKGYNAEQWQMVSNYTPKESMQGRYGVVNAKNCLKIGSATSTINAFAAYISYTGGAAPSMARTAFAGDESTDIDSIDAEGSESDGTSAYDLSGRRISRSAEGIKIVISPDGKVTKVMR